MPCPLRIILVSVSAAIALLVAYNTKWSRRIPTSVTTQTAGIAQVILGCQFFWCLPLEAAPVLKASGDRMPPAYVDAQA